MAVSLWERPLYDGSKEEGSSFWLLGCWTLPGATVGRDSNIMNRIGITWGQWFGGFQTWAQISMMVGAGVVLCAAAYLIFRKQAVQW